MITILSEPKFIQDIHQEYLKLTNFYKNSFRTGIFIKYFNINKLNSTVLEDTNSTYDLYSNSDIKFDIYDYTPVLNINSITNNSSIISDTIGQNIDGTTSIVITTINRPLIHDLISFYPPIGSNEIFRVVNINTSVNAIHSNPEVTHYELELEYAPIVTTDNIKINNNYIYDLSDERYYLKEDYVNKLNKLNELNNIIKDINKYYDKALDIYRYNEFVPYELNKIMILFKRNYNNNYNRLFEKYYSPFGFIDLIRDKISFSDLIYHDLTKINFNIYNLLNKQVETYQWIDKSPPFKTELDNMLFLGYQLFLELNNGQYKY